VIGGLAAALAASSSLASWRDEHAILINTTQSLPNWAFWIDKHRVPQRGDFVVFAPPQTPLITAHFGPRSRRRSPSAFTACPAMW
jgi:conjugal transfer pilin signal peptidase TrbI